MSSSAVTMIRKWVLSRHDLGKPDHVHLVAGVSQDPLFFEAWVHPGLAEEIA
jgi:hypothetical protein